MKRILLQPGQATVDFGLGRRIPFSGPVRTYVIVSAISIAIMALQGTFSNDAQNLFFGQDLDAKFMERVQFFFPFVNLLSPFVTAMTLALFQQGFYFQLHLAYSLHLWTFFIVISTPIVLVPPASISAFLILLVILIATVGYTFVSHSRVYQTTMAERVACVGLVLFSLPLATVLFGTLLFLFAAITV